MAQVFHRNANIVAAASIPTVVVVLVAASLIGGALYRSPYVTQVNIAKAQPIPFSHERHVGGNAIDCRFCHTTVEHSAFAGIPSTETCMTCHSQVLADAPMIQMIHDSWRNDEGIEWTRVHDMPDFVYFDHSVHIAKGVGCTTCHGQIDQMRLTFKVETMHMSWCVDCHSNPEKFVRPREHVFDVDWQAPPDQIAQGLRLVEEYNINVGQLNDCSICHR